MKRILYVCCNFTYGGVEQYILNTIDNMSRDRFSIDVLLPEGRFFDRESDLTERNVRIIKYSCESKIQQALAFGRILRREKYDIVHFHTGHESALLALAGRLAGQKKMVVHSHTTQSGNEDSRALVRAVKRLVFMASDYVYRLLAYPIACSPEAATFMFGRFADKATIMENGIDLDRFWNNRPRTGDRLCINARFDMQKNPFFVVDIMAELVKLNPNAHLDWIGTGSLRAAVEEKIAALDLSRHISLLGFSDEVEKILFQNDYFLLPSLYEGLGIVLIEAQAAGLQCFISDAIPAKADCGYCTVIPLAHSAKQWAETIHQEMGQVNNNELNMTKINSFNIQETTKRLEHIYTILCEER